ncbi:transposase [Kosakonia sp. S42]|nr:transposase [Kosakonia sp. S42]
MPVPDRQLTKALKRTGELYAIEEEISGSPADERLAIRKEKTISLLQSLYNWIQVQMTVLLRHPDTAKAFEYLLKQWGMNSGIRRERDR